jgi:hypothetical protein
MKPRGVLCGDDSVVTQYLDDKQEGVSLTYVNLVPNEKQIAHELESLRLRREELALTLQLRDMAVRIKTLAELPRPGPQSTVNYDIELVCMCLNEATNRSVSEARKLFKKRVHPAVHPKSASKRFTRALNFIISG